MDLTKTQFKTINQIIRIQMIKMVETLLEQMRPRVIRTKTMINKMIQLTVQQVRMAIR